MLFTGCAKGFAAAALTLLLKVVQAFVWGGNGADLLGAAQRTTAPHRVVILLAARVVTGLGQLGLSRLPRMGGSDTASAI